MTLRSVLSLVIRNSDIVFCVLWFFYLFLTTNINFLLSIVPSLLLLEDFCRILSTFFMLWKIFFIIAMLSLLYLLLFQTIFWYIEVHWVYVPVSKLVSLFLPFVYDLSPFFNPKGDISSHLNFYNIVIAIGTHTVYISHFVSSSCLVFIFIY